MSDKIYFNTKNKLSVKKNILNFSTRLHHKLTPKHAEKTAYKVLLTPRQVKNKHLEPIGVLKETLLTSEGKLHTYRLGTGPVWILTHGWSGSASQFYDLMEHIAKRGYTALAYDHPGHGLSSGTQSHMPAFIKGLEAILDNVDNFAGLVGHSMGCASALECQHIKLTNKPMLLVAPVLEYLDNLFEAVEKSGYSMRLFRAVVEKIHTQYNYPLQSIDPYHKLKCRSGKTLIIHDKHDRFANFAVSQRAASETTNVKLVSTQRQGHGRILRCTQLMSAFDTLAK